MFVGPVFEVVKKLASANQRHWPRVIICALVYAAAIVAIDSRSGGLHQSGGIMMWIFIAPPLIMLGHRPRTGVPCSIMIAVLIVYLMVADPWVARHDTPVAQVGFKLVAINMAGFALFIWFTVGVYIWRNELSCCGQASRHRTMSTP